MRIVELDNVSFVFFKEFGVVRAAKRDIREKSFGSIE